MPTPIQPLIGLQGLLDKSQQKEVQPLFSSPMQGLLGAAQGGGLLSPQYQTWMNAPNRIPMQQMLSPNTQMPSSPLGMFDTMVNRMNQTYAAPPPMYSMRPQPSQAQQVAAPASYDAALAAASATRNQEESPFYTHFRRIMGQTATPVDSPEYLQWLENLSEQDRDLIANNAIQYR